MHPVPWSSDPSQIEARGRIPGANLRPGRYEIVHLAAEPASSARMIRGCCRKPIRVPWPRERQRLGNRLARGSSQASGDSPALDRLVGDQGPASRDGGRGRRRIARPRHEAASPRPPAAAAAARAARSSGTGGACAGPRSRAPRAAPSPSVAFRAWKASTSSAVRSRSGRSSCRSSGSPARTSRDQAAPTRLVGVISIVLVVGAIGTAIYTGATEEHEPRPRSTRAGPPG